MSQFTIEQLNSTLAVIDTALKNCRKMQPKFKDGTSQASLLRNRIKALEISQALVLRKVTADGEAATVTAYTAEELKAALPPVISIRNKNMTARKKHEEGTTWYKRFTRQIEAMETAEALIEEELVKRQTRATRE